MAVLPVRAMVWQRRPHLPLRAEPPRRAIRGTARRRNGWAPRLAILIWLPLGTVSRPPRAGYHHAEGQAISRPPVPARSRPYAARHPPGDALSHCAACQSGRDTGPCSASPSERVRTCPATASPADRSSGAPRRPDAPRVLASLRAATRRSPTLICCRSTTIGPHGDGDNSRTGSQFQSPSGPETIPC
jgi:hypothetical protein